MLLQGAGSLKAKALGLLVLLLFSGVFVMNASASHSWGNYHWARTANPFTLQIGDNVSSQWDAYLGTTSGDWSQSTVLDTNIVAGGTTTDVRKCRATSGRVEVCNAKYGNNGWLGVASIWANSDSHITKGTVKVNDTYFNTSKYNPSAWRNFVMCQEVGHTLGLDHQNENFNDFNLGTCMDYTSDPTGTAGTNGTLDNEHPNQHDYDELGIIYTHTDSFTTLLNRLFSVSARVSNRDIDTANPKEWGKEIRKDRKGRGAFYERDLGKSEKLFTFVVWAD